MRSAKPASPILIDKRHLKWASPTFVDKFGGLAKVPTHNLSFADANWWSGDFKVACAVEIKRPKDVLESVLFSGRLIEQWRAARPYFQFYRVIIQGEVGPHPETGNWAEKRWTTHNGRRVFDWVEVAFDTKNGPQTASYRRVDNWFNSLEIIDGLQTRWTRSEDETVRQIIDLYLWWQKDLLEHETTLESRFHTPVFMPGMQHSLVRRMAKELGGIGVDRSKVADDHFRSVLEMAVSGVEEWMKIPGIGKVMAERIVHELRYMRAARREEKTLVGGRRNGNG